MSIVPSFMKMPFAVVAATAAMIPASLDIAKAEEPINQSPFAAVKTAPVDSSTLGSNLASPEITKATPINLTPKDGEPYQIELERKVDKLLTTYGIPKSPNDFPLKDDYGRLVKDSETGQVKVDEKKYSEYRDLVIDVAKSFKSTSEFGRFASSLIAAKKHGSITDDQIHSIFTIARLDPEYAMSLSGQAYGATTSNFGNDQSIKSIAFQISKFKN